MLTGGGIGWRASTRRAGVGGGRVEVTDIVSDGTKLTGTDSI